MASANTSAEEEGDAVVLRDVPPGATAVGNPARLIPATPPGPTE